jgi:branched-chain amino acid transport system ATP-binding protein
LLSLKDVHTYYGDSHVLKGLSFQMRKGELATLLGRNGAGKSTALKSIMGLVPPRGGSILLEGAEISTQRPHKIASMGVGYVPEERIIFPSLSVAENLSFAARKKQKGLWDPEKIFRHFPIFKKRSHHKGSQLSGGEQQMLAIARVLMMNVSLILLDEPTEG